MNELALFAGSGGGILGTKLLGWRVIGAVELDPYCREVILRRQEEGILEPFPVWDDIRTFDGKPWRGKVDIVTGGFPCQPFSVAGKQAGESDERNMWPDTIRVIREVRPRYCFLENVPNLLVHGYFGAILKDLVESGYDCRWDCIPASAIGAPHRRDRLWIVADTGYWSGRSERSSEAGRECSTRRAARSGTTGGSSEQSEVMADTQELSERSGLCESETPGHWIRRPGNSGRKIRTWTSEPRLGRVADRVAYRVDRLKAIGNGQVPEVVRTAWELLNETNDT